ncbi:MAG TPA: hypothetical protein VKY15_04040 [Acidimicrobiales bacterium]|nr:hypothetical protein [Acidimicrobiales bacterium]
MTNIVYLAAAAGFSLLASLVAMALSRRKPSMEAAIREFSRELSAIAPQERERHGRSRRTGRAPAG